LIERGSGENGRRERWWRRERERDGKETPSEKKERIERKRERERKNVGWKKEHFSRKRARKRGTRRSERAKRAA